MLVIQITKINYFIQGTLVSFIAYISWFLFSFSHLNWLLTILIIAISGILINTLSYLLIFKRFYEQKSSFSLMFLVSLSLVVILENLIQIIFGANVKVLNLNFLQHSLDFLGAIVNMSQICVIAASILACTFSFWVIYKTNIGKIWQALNQNRKLFQSLGYNLNFNSILVFMFSGVLAALAGICLSLERSLTPQIGTNLFLTAFVAASLANYELKWFWLACALIAIMKTVFVWFLPSGWSDGLVFGLLGVWLVGRHSSNLFSKLNLIFS